MAMEQMRGGGHKIGVERSKGARRAGSGRAAGRAVVANPRAAAGQPQWQAAAALGRARQRSTSHRERQQPGAAGVRWIA